MQYLKACAVSLFCCPWPFCGGFSRRLTKKRGVFAFSSLKCTLVIWSSCWRCWECQMMLRKANPILPTAAFAPLIWYVSFIWCITPSISAQDYIRTTRCSEHVARTLVTSFVLLTSRLIIWFQNPCFLGISMISFDQLMQVQRAWIVSFSLFSFISRQTKKCNKEMKRPVAHEEKLITVRGQTNLPGLKNHSKAAKPLSPL